MEERDCWRALGAVVAGLRHARKNEPCQDHLQWRLFDTALLCVMADGAGTASRGGDGARMACEAGLEFLAAKFKDPGVSAFEPILREALRQARDRIEKKAGELSLEPRDFACTFLAFIATDAGCAGLQVGDGACLVQRGDQPLSLLIRPAMGEYLNETTFLTADDALEKARFEQGLPITKAALFTDGLQMLALKWPAGDAHLPFFAPLLRFLETAANLQDATRELSDFLRSPKITSRSDDDITLFLAVRKPPEKS
jgi:hypothetical protein